MSQGDYNSNGAVDAADYVMWRKNQGNSVAHYASPDGSGNAVVDTADYTVWRSHFGQTFPVPGAGIGSGANETTLSTASESLQGSASPPAADQNLTTKTTTVASADLNLAGSALFTITAPTGPAIVSHVSTFKNGSAVGNVALRNDEGLLAWLSTSSTQQPTGNSDFGDDSHNFLADDTDRLDAADSALEKFAPFTRTTGAVIPYGVG